MIITVDPSSPVPPYEQVRAAITTAINNGSLSPGARLPTVRELAGDLALAPNTVARAYRELESGGAVETRGRRGTFVTTSPRDPTHTARLAAHAYAQRCRDIGIDPEHALALAQTALGLAPQNPATSTPGPGQRRASSSGRTNATETPDHVRTHSG